MSVFHRHPPDPRVAFLASKEREILPMQNPRHRMGNEFMPFRGEPHLGPARYDTENHTNLIYNIKKRVLSTKGYTLGARTGPRMMKRTALGYPSPAHYQRGCTDPKVFEQEVKPFASGSERWPIKRQELRDCTPWAGTYDVDIPQSRQVSWHQSFGGAPIMMPPITIKSSIPRNTEKLCSTKDERKYLRRLSYLKLFYD